MERVGVDALSVAIFQRTGLLGTKNCDPWSKIDLFYRSRPECKVAPLSTLWMMIDRCCEPFSGGYGLLDAVDGQVARLTRCSDLLLRRDP